MSQDPFSQFIAFVHADAACYTLEQKLAQLQERRLQAQTTLELLAQSMRAAHKTAHDRERQCAAQELEIRVLRDRLKAVTTARDTAHTVKEFQASSQEAERLTTQIDSAEDHLIAQDELRQAALHAHAQAVQEHLIAQQAWDTQEPSWAHELAQAQEQYQQACAARDEHRQHVLPEYITAFQARKARVPNPAVPVVNQACSACYHTLPMREYMLLKRHIIGYCDQCYRMLFIP